MYCTCNWYCNQVKILTQTNIMILTAAILMFLLKSAYIQKKGQKISSFLTFLFSQKPAIALVSVMVFIWSERSGCSSPPSLQKCRKAAPPKKCRKEGRLKICSKCCPFQKCCEAALQKMPSEDAILCLSSPHKKCQSSPPKKIPQSSHHKMLHRSPP